MKKIIKVFMIISVLFIVFTFSSCKKVHIIDSNDGQKFVDEYYEYIADNKQGFIALDLRYLETEYAQGHLQGFKSYQYYIARNKNEPDSVYNQRISETFIKWMTLNHSKDKTVFLMDADGNLVTEVSIKLKDAGYKNIYIYKGGYENIKAYLNNKIEIVTGVDDCGC